MPNPKNTATLDEFVEAGASVTISYDNLALSEHIGNIKYPIYNIVNDYLLELMVTSVTVELSLDEYNKYKYRPKLLAEYLYGNTEVYFIILLLNNVCNVKDFNFKKLKLLTKEDMKTLLSAIYTSEKDFLDTYNNKHEEISE